MKKIIVILSLLFVVTFSGCSSNTDIDNQQQGKQDNLNFQRNIPEFPPEFNLPNEFSNLTIDDYTESFKGTLSNEEVIYSATWTYDKEYNLSWKEMNKEQRDSFNSLKESLIQSLNQSVENLGGEFTIEEGTNYDVDGVTYGRWELKSESNPRVNIWRVDFNSGLNNIDNKPFMNVYIAHTKMK